MGYNAEDYKGAPAAMLQYIIANVDDFDSRYEHALFIIDQHRCPLQVADCSLYQEISDNMDDWCDDNGCDAEGYDIEEIFG